MSETTGILKVSGMHCRSCSMNVDLTLEDIAGVVSSETDLTAETTTVVFDPDLVSLDSLASAVTEAGYDAEPLS